MFYLVYQLHLRWIQLWSFLCKWIFIAFYILMINNFTCYIGTKILLFLRHVSAYLFGKRDSHHLSSCFIKFIFFCFVIHLTKTSYTHICLSFYLDWKHKSLIFLKFLHFLLNSILLFLFGIHLIKLFTINYICLIFLVAVFSFFIVFIWSSFFF